MGVIAPLAAIVAGNTAYFASLALLAWFSERQRGTDAFHMVPCYAAGVWVAYLFESYQLSTGAALFMATVVASACYVGVELVPARQDSGRSLLVLVITATTALLLFDWATNHTPVSLTYHTSLPLRLSALFALLLWILIVRKRNADATLYLRLGARNRWVLSYWQRQIPNVFVLQLLVAPLCWVAIMQHTLTTTGVLSSTVLKDVALGVLFARIVDTRPMGLLLALSATLSMLRVSAAYAFLSPLAPPLIEFSALMTGFMWLKRRTHRTSWEDAVVR